MPNELHSLLAVMWAALLVTLVICSDTCQICPPADCCDGSDESSGKCSNTCAQAGAAARAALKAAVATEAAGAKVKEGYVKQAQNSKQKWQAEEQEVAQQIAQQQKIVEQWKSARSGHHLVTDTPS